MLLPGDISKKKRRDLSQSYDKSPYTKRNVKSVTGQHKDVTKNSITQRLRTDFGRSNGVNHSHPTGMVNWFTGQTSPLPAKAM